MKKSCIALTLVFLIIISIIPVCATDTIRFNSEPKFYEVKDGREYQTDFLPNGTVRAKVELRNRISYAQTVVLYIASKTDDNRMINVNMKTLVLPEYSDYITEYVDIEVSDNTKETVYFYIWNEMQDPCCDPEILERAPSKEDEEAMLYDNYGFILDVSKTRENVWNMEVRTKEGAWKTYKVAYDFSVLEWSSKEHRYIETTYGKENNTVDTFMSMLSELTEFTTSEIEVYENTKLRFVTYASKGDVITKIKIASNSVSPEDLDTAYEVAEFKEATYNPLTKQFSGYTYTDETMFLYAPITSYKPSSQSPAYYGIETEDVGLISRSFLETRNVKCNGYMYDINSDNEFNAALITSDIEFAGINSALAVVMRLSEGLDSNGEKTDMITVMRGGEVSSYVINREAEISFLTLIEPGDIIQFALNDVDEITEAYLVFDAENGLGRLTPYATVGSIYDTSFVYGIVSDCASRYITLSTDHSDYSTYIDFAVNLEEGQTLAKVDMVKLFASPNSAITKATSPSSFRRTSDTYESQYVMVARVVDDEFVDAVLYVLDVEKLDANRDGAELNGHTYNITIE